MAFGIHLPAYGPLDAALWHTNRTAAPAGRAHVSV